MNRPRARIGLLAALASVTLASGLLFASPVDPHHPAPLVGRATPFAHSTATQEGGFRTLRMKWEQRLPLGGPIVSLGPDGLAAASRTGIHVIDSGGHEALRSSLEPAADVLSLLSDGRLLAQTGTHAHGICLPISACRKPYSTTLPFPTSGLPAIPLAGGGAFLAAGPMLIALDSDGRIWGTTDLGGPITALYAGTSAGYAGAAIAIVDGKNGSRIRTFHPGGAPHTIAELDNVVTSSALSGRSLYVALSGTTLALLDAALGTAVPLVQVPGGIYAMSAYASKAAGAGSGAAALVGTALGYSLLLTTSLGTRQIPVETLPFADGGPPPVGIGYAAIVSDSNGFVAFLTPSGALSMLTADGSLLRFGERPCGTERLPRAPVLTQMPGIGLVLGCPSGRTVAFVSE